MINLHIILDKLVPFKPVAHVKDDLIRDLHGVRLFSKVADGLSSCYLYIVEESEIGKIDLNTEDLHLLVIGKNRQSYLFSQAAQSVIISCSLKPIELLTLVQEVFDHYSIWQEKMLWMIAERKAIQDIFLQGIVVLENPIAMFDSSWALIAKGGEFPEVITDPTWLSVLQTGYASMDDTDVAVQGTQIKKLETAKEPFLLPSVSGEENAYLAASLFKKGKRFAALGSVSINSPFTKGQLSLVAIMKEMMEAAFLHDEIHSNIANGMSQHVNKLLQGIAVDADTVSEYLSKLKWNLHDDYLVFYFELIGNELFDDDLKWQHIARINRFLINSYVSPHENGILAIIHNDINRAFTNDFKNTLSTLIQKFNLVCGISMPFSDFMNIRNAYVQAKVALKGEYLQENLWLYDFKTHYLDHIISSLASVIPIESVCHPKILQLVDRNDLRGSELIQTLYLYLLNGRNASATAKFLHVHRNTLVYRLNTLNQYLDHELDDLNENEMVVLLISCMIVKEHIIAR